MQKLRFDLLLDIYNNYADTKTHFILPLINRAQGVILDTAIIITVTKQLHGPFKGRRVLSLTQR